MIDRWCKAQRWLLLALTACGAPALLAVLAPQLVARELMGKALSGGAVVLMVQLGAHKLTLAMIAFFVARAPRPPRTIVLALVVGLVLGVAGAWAARFIGWVPAAELQPMRAWLWVDTLLAAALVVTMVGRARSRA